MRIFTPRYAATSGQKMLDFYSQFNPSPLSIKQFIDFGKYFFHINVNVIHILAVLKEALPPSDFQHFSSTTL